MARLALTNVSGEIANTYGTIELPRADIPIRNASIAKHHAGLELWSEPPFYTVRIHWTGRRANLF